MSAPRLKDRSFGVMFAAVFAIIFAVGWFIFDVRLYWSAYSSAAFLAVALMIPSVLLPFNRLWGVFAGRLGIINNYLVLGIFLYLIITPLGLVMRAFGWDPLARRPNRKADTYWAPLDRRTNRDTLKDMF